MKDEEPVQAAAESPVMQEILDRLRGHIHEASDMQEQPAPQEQPEATHEQHEPIQEPAPTAESPVMQEILDRLRGHIHEAGNMQEQQAQEALEQPAQHWPQDDDAPAPDPVSTELQDVWPLADNQYATENMHETMHTEPSVPEIQVPAEIAAHDDTPKEEDFVPPFSDPAPAAIADPGILEEQPPVAPTLEAYTAPAGEQHPEQPVVEEHPVTEEAPLFKIIIETPSAKHDTLFEPYHTIEYFASLGIRLDKMEPNPQDKLGKQLRSFTEWLKSMKKLPQASIEKVLGENEESAVVAAASHSIVGKDVITEAMAEVFEKQGLYDKAIEVYHKLSLLNPSKSAYFAGRINALKRE